MKIGFDAKRFFHNSSGLGNYSRDFVYKLIDLYPQNNFFLFNPIKEKLINLDEDYKDKITEINPEGLFYDNFRSLWRYRGMTKQIKNLDLDVYHGLSAELPVGIEKLNNIKKIVTVHDLIFMRFPEFYSWFDVNSHIKKVKFACSVADKIIATSNKTKQDLIELLKINESKIEVIYQGCNDLYTQEFNSSYKINIIEKFNLPEKFILNVGTIEKRKNILTILKSLKELPKDINLVVIGKKKKYFEELLKYIKENELEDRVWFLENLVVSEIVVIYRMAYCFIYPSIFEGFGIPLIEAMFSKIPVITSNTSSLPEIAGKHSFTIDPLDYKDLTKKIELLLNNKDISDKMINNNYNYVIKTFEKDSLTKKIFNLYKNN